MAESPLPGPRFAGELPADTDVVVVGAGIAGTSAAYHLAAAGVASLRIPFPHAVDDHQTVNARFLSERGAAVLLPQEQMTPERLAELLRGMTRERAMEMARAARAAAQPESARKVAEACMAVAK